MIWAKPTKQIITLAAGLAWGIEPGIIYQQKEDGRFDPWEWSPGNVLACELLPDGRRIAFDALMAGCGDLRGMPLAARLDHRNRMASIAGVPIVAATTGRGGAFLRDGLAAGWEGVCRKSLSATWYDAMEVCKKSVTLVCRVTSTGGTQSVGIADPVTGQDRGAVTLRGGKCDRVRVGSLIRLEAMEIHPSGKLRQPTLCTNWLVQY